MAACTGHRRRVGDEAGDLHLRHARVLRGRGSGVLGRRRAGVLGRSAVVQVAEVDDATVRRGGTGVLFHVDVETTTDTEHKA
jgi:hypothetical protein